MRKRIFGIPLSLAIVLVAVPLAALAAYTIITLTGSITVQEAITVSPSTFTANIYPGETHTAAVTLNNASSVSIDVSFTSTITPATTEVTLSAPNKVTVPGGGSATANVQISASKSAPPDTYTISLGLTR